MPLPTTIADLSLAEGSNYPDGGASPAVLDNTQRMHATFIAKLRDLVGLVTGTYVPATAIANMGLTPTALGAAAAGANTDITSLAACTTVTPSASDNDTSIATTAFVQGELTSQAVKLTGAQTIAGVKTFSSMPVVPTQGMVIVNTPNGAGSTNTCVQNFATVVTNQGSDITYAASGVNGATFTVNVSGVYACSLSGKHPNANGHCGVSLNSGQLTTNIEAITAANRLCLGQGYAVNAAATSSWTGYIAAGGIVRVHTDNSNLSLTTSFTISRVG